MSNLNKDSVDLAKDEALRQRKGGQAKQMILWFAALIFRNLNVCRETVESIFC